MNTNKSHCTISLRAAFLSVVVLLSATTVACCILFSVQVFKGIFDLSATLRSKTMDSIRRILEVRINNIRTEIDVAMPLLAMPGVLSNTNFTHTRLAMVAYYRELLKNHKTGFVGYVGFDNGNTYSLVRDVPQGNRVHNMFWNSTEYINPGFTKNIADYYLSKDVNDPVEPLGVMWSPEPAYSYINTVSQWAEYVVLVKSKGAQTVWAEAVPWGCVILPGFGLRCFVLLAYYATRWRSPGKYAFYINELLTAESISEELSVAISQIPSAIGYMIERSSCYIIGVSDYKIQVMNATSVQLFDPAKFPTDIIRNSYAEVKRKYGAKFEMINSVLSGENNTFGYYDNDVKDYVYVNIAGLVDDFELDWIIVATVPQLAIIGNVLILGIVTCVIALLILIVGNIIAVLATFVIIKPIVKIVEQMTLVEHMRLDKINTTAGLSAIKEVQQIQSAFFIMVDKLKEYQAFLPQHILNRDYKDEDPEGSSANMKNIISSGKVVPSPRIEKTGSRQSISTAAAGGGTLSLGIEQKEATLAGVYILNFKDLQRAHTAEEMVQLFSRIQEIVMAKLSESRGVVNTLTEKSFLICWNCAVPCKHHIINACDAVYHIKHKLDEFIRESEAEGFHVKPIVAFCVATDLVFCGNLGNNVKRTFCIYGNAVETLKSLKKHCTNWPAAILLDSKVASTAIRRYHVRQLPDLINCSASVHELYYAKDGNSEEEWMYELKTQQEQATIEMYNHAYDLMSQNDFAGALALFTEYVKQTPSDVHAKTVLEHCNKQLS